MDTAVQADAGADHGDGAPGGPPPWIDESMQQRMAWRDGDVVIAVPPKSGTTWTMNIVHQLRTGGDADFADVYAEVPWIEFVPNPTVDRDAIVAGFDAMGTDRFRAFKSHALPGTVPYFAPGAGPAVRYVVVVRNPDEAVASFYPFINAHADGFFAAWGVPREAVAGGSFAEYFAGLGSHGITPWIFGFVAGWWALREQPNVLLLHYNDMKADHEGSVQRIADFLGITPSPEERPAILEYTSFGWMKAHEDKFEARTVSNPTLLDPGAMIRKGRAGAAAEDGITPEISAAIAGIGRAILTDPAAFRWCYEGGPLPS
jgi:aryl sulfotransferase